MTLSVTELHATARSLAREGVVVTAVLSLALTITASLVIAALDRSMRGAA